MSARTPGPWALPLQHTATAPQTTVIAERDGCIVEVATTAGMGKTIFESEANARLIAAAPELLRAAQAVMPYFDLMWPPEDTTGSRGWLREGLRAAIAKAEGRE